MRSTTPRLRTALTALLATVMTAAVAAPAPAAAPQAKDVRWRIVKVHLDGYSMYRLDDGDYRYALDGRVKYRTTKGKLKGKPFKVKPGTPNVGQVSGGIDWSTTNTASISGEHGSYSCPFSRQEDAGLAGIFVVRGQRVDVQLSLAPAYMRCPSEAPIWSFEPMPLKAMTTSFKLRQLDARRKQVKVYVDVKHRWTERSGTNAEVHWDGHLTFERVL